MTTKTIMKTMETMQITEVPCSSNITQTYCEGMVTEDNKDKKKTQDIIAG